MLNRKRMAVRLVACAMMGTALSSPAPAQDRCGESALLAARNQLNETRKVYSTATRHAEMRGLASLDLAALSATGVPEVMFGNTVATSSLTSDAPARPAIDPDRSLFIRDLDLVSAFSFEELMEALARRSDIPAPGALTLFQDWWLTALPHKSGKDTAIGCTDHLINGMEYSCPQSGGHGSLASLTSLAPPVSADGTQTAPAIKIMALVNRGDLWSFAADSPDCGEYRVIAGLDNSSQQITSVEKGLFLFGFEAVLRRGDNGPGFCKAVQELWASFSTTQDRQDLKSQLRRFYLERSGLTQDGRLVPPSAASARFTFGPILTPENLGLDGELPELGQIRTNSKFKSGDDQWFFREYRFRRLSGTGKRILPVGLAATPVKTAGDPSHPLNGKLAAEIAGNADGLATHDFDDVSFATSDRCLDAAEDTANNGKGIRSIMQKYFSGRYSNPAVAALKSLERDDLVVRDIANNLEFTTCVGCHNTTGKIQLGHLVAPYAGFDIDGRLADTWKSPPNFHFMRFDLEPNQDGSGPAQYQIAPQLENVFLPKRLYVMRFVLENDPQPSCLPGNDGPDSPSGCPGNSNSFRLFEEQ